MDEQLSAISSDARDRASRSALAEVALNAPGAFYQFRLSPSGAISIPFASPTFAARLEIELAGPEENATRVFSRIHPDDLPKLNAAIAKSAGSLAEFEIEFRLLASSGREVWLEARSSPVRTPDGGLLWNGVVADVTARKTAEAALREGEERYRSLFAANPQPMWLFDVESLAFLEVNDAAVARYGWTRDEFLAMTIADIRPPEDLPPLRRAVARTAAGEIDDAGIWRHRRKDGTVILVEITSHALRYHDRRAELVLAHDVTAREATEAALSDSEERLRTTLAIAPIGIAEAEPDTGRLLQVNETLCRMLGYTVDELVGLRIRDLTHPADRERDDVGFRSAAAGDSPGHAIEKRYLCKDGTVAWGSVKMAVLRDPAGKATRCVATIEDIGDRRKAESALRASEQRFRAMFESAAIGVAQAIPETGTWTAVNPRFCEITGYTEAELLSMRVPELTHPDDREKDWRLFQRVVRGDLSEYRIEKRYMRKGGSVAWVNVNMVVLRNEKGVAERTLAMVEDITERKAAEVRLETLATERQESLEWQREIFEGSRDAVFLSDAEGAFVGVNRAAEEMTGYSREELLTMRIPDLHDEIDLAAYSSHGRILAGERILSEAPLRRKDGAKVDVEFSNSRVVVGGSAFVHTSGRDVTERRRSLRRLTLQATIGRVLAEAPALAEAIPRILQALGESEGMSFGAWWEWDPDAGQLRCAHTWCIDGGRCADLDAATRALAVRPGHSIPGVVWTSKSVCHEPKLDRTKHSRAEVAARGGLFSAVGFPLFRDDRVAGVVEYFATDLPAVDPALAATVEILGGQIAQYRARRRAQEEAARYVAGSPAVLYALRVSGADVKVSWFSDNLHALTGFSRAEIEPDAEAWWLDGIHPEDRTGAVEANKTVLEKGAASLEFRFRRKDGSWFWVRDEKRLLRDDSGRTSEIVGSWIDVTDRVRLEEQFRQSQKMEAVGQLAGGVAHDFNNLLTVISGNCELLLTETPPDDPRRGPLTDVRAAGERAANLTRQLLAFSRKQILEPRLVDVHAVLDDLERMLRRLIGEDIDLATEFAADPSWVKVDPGQLEQVIMNLAVNARDAMPRGGRLLLATRSVTPSGQMELDETAGRRPRPRVGISISDTGTGIAPEIRARLFEPFFTTKAVGKGTGLGLATVYGIVKQSGGDITVDSEPGRGTTFTIVLPSHAAPRRGVSGASHHGVPRGSETILAVEDEDAVRRIVKIALESTGYRVLEARSGAEALEAARRHAGRIDLLLTDVVMPEMSGRELAERIAKEKAGIRILFMSGYTDDAVMRHGIVEAGVGFLQKPFSPLVLARKVRGILDARS